MIEVLRRTTSCSPRRRDCATPRVLLRHALKNALLPTVTVAALETGSLLGGNMVVETVFGWPGLGRLVVESIFVAQLSARAGGVLLYAVTYVLVNFAADVLYTVLNPRVRAVSAIAAASVAGRRASALRRAHRTCANSLRDRMVAACRRRSSSLFVLMAVFAPWIAPHDPYDTDLLRRLQPPAWMEGGDCAYLLGCDALGRDILSRIIYGARVSIVIGVVVVLLATAHRHRCRTCRRLSARLRSTRRSRASSISCSAFPT